MTITKNAARQGVISALVDIALADLAAEAVDQSQTLAYGALVSATAYSTTIALPVGAVVTGGDVTIVTPFNSATSDVLDVGDATSGNRYLNDADLQQAGATVIPLVPTGFVVTAGQPVIKVTWTKVGTAPSAGAFTIDVTYEIPESTVVVDVPAGSIVVGGAIKVTEAFDSSISDTLVIGDSTSPTRYGSGIDGQAEALTALTLTGYETTTEQGVTVKLTRLGDAPAAGAATLSVDYIRDGRSHFTQG